jgi:RNA polymerase sigma factor (sigma-70 family)
MDNVISQVFFPCCGLYLGRYVKQKMAPTSGIPFDRPYYISKHLAMTQSEFSHSVNLFSGALRLHALNFTKDPDDANDLLQDTLVKATRFAENFNQGTNIKGWLFVIMRNTFINSYRKGQRHRDRIVQVEEISSANLSHSATSNYAESKFAMEDIKNALNRLPTAYSVPFIRYFEGYKYQEIAEELGIPVGTVKTHIHQARLQLKKQLKQYKKQ